MANLNITEFATGRASFGSQQADVSPQPFLAAQNVAIGGASVASAVFNAQTRVVRLVAEAACHVKFGDTAAASGAAATDMLVPANVPEYFAVRPSTFLSVIT